MIGASPAMQRVFREVAHACTSPAAVVISGASGTGKTLAARVIHANSEGAGPLTVFECGAGPSAAGEIGKARGGTVLLENIDRLSDAEQSALLAVVEAGGAPRLISTSRIPLHEAVGEGQFREDLYYRLRGVEIRLPTVGERLDDIPALAAYFLGRACSDRTLILSEEALDSLCEREWPGNVRELRNAIEYGVSVCGGTRLLPQHLPPVLGRSAAKGSGLEAALGRWIESQLSGSETPPSYSELLDEVERVLLKKLLKRYGGKPTHLAAELRMNRTTLRKRLERLGIE